MRPRLLMIAALLLGCCWAASVAGADAAATAPTAASPAATPPPPLLLPLTWETDDFQYYVDAALGQDAARAQPFRLLLDTGSANLWVPAAECSSAACEGRARLDPTAPGAFQGTGGPQIQIAYGDSSIAGIGGTTTVRLNGTFLSSSSSGGGSNSQASSGGIAFSQPIVLATNISGGALGSSSYGGGGGNQQGAPWDGLMGMGREALAVRWMRPPVLSMADQGQIAAPIFGLYLSHDPRAPGRGGELALGGWNPARMAGDVNWVPIVPSPAGQNWQGFWSVALDAIQLEGGSGSSSSSSSSSSGSSGSSSSSGGGTGGGTGGGAGGAPEVVLCSSGTGGSCVGAFDSGTGLVTGTLRQVGALNRRLGFAPGVPPPPAGCQAEAARLAALLSQVGAANPNSGTALSTACQALGGGALSPEASLCGQLVSNIDSARAALQPGGRGPPSPEVLAAAVAETVADCEQLPYAFNASIECDKAEKLPSVSFVIGGRSYALAPLQYAARGPAGRCYSMIQALGNLPDRFWILGDSLMHMHYTIFDYGSKTGKPRVGLASLSPAEEKLRAELDALLAAPLPAPVSGAAGRGWRRSALLAAGAAAAAGWLLLS